MQQPIVEKKRFTGLDTDTDSRLLEATRYRYGLNVRVGNTSQEFDGAVENLKGNTIIHNTALPAGLNKTIGTHEDGKSNRLIFWNWNSAGNHAIYLIKNDVITEVISGEFLGFQENVYIKGAGVVDDLCYWTEGDNMRGIDLSKDYTGITNPTIDLHKIAPLEKLVINGKLNSAKFQNRIAADSWQVTYQYVFENNETTPFAPFSNLEKAYVVPQLYKEPDVTQQNNEIYVALPASFPEGVKQINLAYRKNNVSALFIFKTLNIPLSDNDGLVVASINTGDDPFTPNVPVFANKTCYIFSNTETPIAVADSEAAKLFEAIPNRSEALAIAENRIFVANIREGLTIDEKAMEDEGFVITPYSIPEQINSPAADAGKSISKGGDPFSVGLVFHKDKISSGVHFVRNVSPRQFPALGFSTNFFEQMRMSVTGELPAGIDSFSVVRTKGSFYKQYMQLPVRVWYYYADKVEGGSNPPFDSADWTIGNGLYFYLLGGNRYDRFNFLHLQLPRGIPWVPDKNTFIRILHPQGYGKVQRVLEVKGNIVVCGDFGLSSKKDSTGINDYNFVNLYFGVNDGGGASDTYNYWRVEFFQQLEASDEIFYEAAGPYPRSVLDNGVLNINIPGNAYAINKGLSYFDRTTPKDTPIAQSNFQYSFPFEYPAPTMLETGINVNLVRKNNVIDKPYIDYQYDLTKEASNIGRPFVRIENEKEVVRNGTLRYSNRYIQTSNINGLSNFDALDEYVLPSERSPVRKLLLVKNVLLAIHERETTSLYIGEGFIKTAEGSDTLTKTDSVIGADRVVAGVGNFGTIHPESAIEHDGMAFWYDAYSGAACRYTLAGIFPISNYGMRAYFKELGKKYTDQPAKIIGGYDPEFDEYLLTFLAIPGVEAQTWCFNVKTEKWTSRYSFTPECYGKLGNSLYSFENGRCWKHNNSNIYNNFYGVQFQRKLKFIANALSAKVKVFTNIHIKMDQLCVDPDGEFKVAQYRLEDGQYSFTPAYELAKIEGVHRGQIFKSFAENESNPDIRAGEDMRAEVMEVEISTDLATIAVMRDVNIVYNLSEYSN